MNSLTAAPRLYTLGDLSKLWQVAAWKLRRCFELRLVPEPARVRGYRVLTEADLPALRAAAEARGYLPRITAA